MMIVSSCNPYKPMQEFMGDDITIAFKPAKKTKIENVDEYTKEKKPYLWINEVPAAYIVTDNERTVQFPGGFAIRVQNVKERGD